MAEFLQQMHPRAMRFVESGGQREQAYLMSIGELMARLQPPTISEARHSMRSFRKQLSENEGFVMWVAMFQIDAGKGFSHHDHRDYNGLIMGVEGEAHIQNFDILGDSLVPPKGETFQIRQTRDDIVLPGGFSSLGTKRDNVHALTAGPEGATVLDVFTYMHSDARSYYMDVDATPRDAERKIYDASWS